MKKTKRIIICILICLMMVSLTSCDFFNNTKKGTKSKIKFTDVSDIHFSLAYEAFPFTSNDANKLVEVINNQTWNLHMEGKPGASAKSRKGKRTNNDRFIFYAKALVASDTGNLLDAKDYDRKVIISFDFDKKFDVAFLWVEKRDENDSIIMQYALTTNIKKEDTNKLSELVKYYGIDETLSFTAHSIEMFENYGIELKKEEYEIFESTLLTYISNFKWNMMPYQAYQELRKQPLNQDVYFVMKYNREYNCPNPFDYVVIIDLEKQIIDAYYAHSSSLQCAYTKELTSKEVSEIKEIISGEFIEPIIDDRITGSIFYGTEFEMTETEKEEIFNFLDSIKYQEEISNGSDSETIIQQLSTFTIDRTKIEKIDEGNLKLIANYTYIINFSEKIIIKQLKGSKNSSYALNYYADLTDTMIQEIKGIFRTIPFEQKLGIIVNDNINLEASIDGVPYDDKIIRKVGTKIQLTLKHTWSFAYGANFDSLSDIMPTKKVEVRVNGKLVTPLQELKSSDVVYEFIVPNRDVTVDISLVSLSVEGHIAMSATFDNKILSETKQYEILIALDEFINKYYDESSSINISDIYAYICDYYGTINDTILVRISLDHMLDEVIKGYISLDYAQQVHLAPIVAYNDGSIFTLSQAEKTNLLSKLEVDMIRKRAGETKINEYSYLTNEIMFISSNNGMYRLNAKVIRSVDEFNSYLLNNDIQKYNMSCEIFEPLDDILTTDFFNQYSIVMVPVYINKNMLSSYNQFTKPSNLKRNDNVLYVEIPFTYSALDEYQYKAYDIIPLPTKPYTIYVPLKVNKRDVNGVNQVYTRDALTYEIVNSTTESHTLMIDHHNNDYLAKYPGDTIYENQKVTIYLNKENSENVSVYLNDLFYTSSFEEVLLDGKTVLAFSFIASNKDITISFIHSNVVTKYLPETILDYETQYKLVLAYLTYYYGGKFYPAPNFSAYMDQYFGCFNGRHIYQVNGNFYQIDNSKSPINGVEGVYFYYNGKLPIVVYDETVGASNHIYDLKQALIKDVITKDELIAISKINNKGVLYLKDGHYVVSTSTDKSYESARTNGRYKEILPYGHQSPKLNPSFVRFFDDYEDFMKECEIFKLAHLKNIIDQPTFSQYVVMVVHNHYSSQPSYTRYHDIEFKEYSGRNPEVIISKSTFYGHCDAIMTDVNLVFIPKENISSFIPAELLNNLYLVYEKNVDKNVYYDN